MVQGGECAAVRTGANATTCRLWQPKTYLFLGEYSELQERMVAKISEYVIWSRSSRA